MDFYIIHLERARQRRANVDRLARTLPGRVKVIEAVDASQLTDDEAGRHHCNARHLPRYPFRMRRTEVACFLSHRLAWSQIARADGSFAMVLEDDCAIDPAVFERALALATSVASEDDFIRFPTSLRETPLHVLKRDGEFSVFQPRHCGLGMRAQLVGRSAARLLLDATETFDRPVDTTLQMTWACLRGISTAWPSGVSDISNELGGSTIGFDKTLAEQVHHELARPPYRLAINLLGSWHAR
ncbi:GR25 family glycosyltransferase involved in LPS biosynthesis [Hoeflea marina]|uniref:GR25 family glycosyltransferase involved in LPS biosynthesis n=1 Tax=Hoeflea marina TaxID=274592 RepID=A0A317PMU4_9HYPH|nr:glycosyltransferase family 25 protein [Hoeflea marina]PWW02076.1 GR25 family glycosyltransferase involved in LPS biosynthesis [Hoeflea marina]